MRRSLTVCCDANVVVRLVTGVDGGPATELWRRWRDDGVKVVAPFLLRYEVTNALHRLRLAGELSADGAAQFLEAALDLPISYSTDDDLHDRATRLAAHLIRPATYDAHYLALAERIGASFWTGDSRLYNAVHHHLDWVHLVGA